MKKQSGIHFYINIVNFNKIIQTEEFKTNAVTHSIHALDTFFSSIESFGKKKYPKSFVVEKITGSRLHLYVTDVIGPAYDVVRTVSAFAFSLARVINHDIEKYKSLLDFQIQIGADFGVFYDFEFKLSEKESEITTIGYPANYAAKLQGLAGSSHIAISSKIYSSLSSELQKGFERVDSQAVEKYGQKCFYRLPLMQLKPASDIDRTDMDFAKDHANSFNLSDIDFSEARVPIDFRNISTTQCKRVYGIPVFSDIRDFTKQFAPDGSNLEEMAQKTQSILGTMYDITRQYDGIHIQFQGDRELSLYHNLPERTTNGVFQPEKKCFRFAVLASMRMIDRVKPFIVHIGVGEDFGRLFATRIGAHGEKDNILLGDTVIQADIMEDKYAGEDQLAITREVYDGLKGEDSFLASQFKLSGEHYVATIGYQEYLRKRQSQQQHNNTASNNYNPAWRN